MGFRHSLIAIALGSFILAGCGGGGGGGGKSGGSTASSHVTLSGTVAAPQLAGMAGGGPHTLATGDFSGYSLYCVTFSTPARSGSGQFDMNGMFSLTLADAAGLPMGCFITNAADNSIVTTLTFTVGPPSGLGDGTSGSATFPGGTYTITINFDPVTKTATADVQNVAGGGTSSEPATFDPAALAGPWTIQCAAVGSSSPSVSDEGGSGSGGDDQDEHCRIDGSSVFIDVVSATVDGAPVYALGAWPDQATFEAAGKTEGMAGTLPDGVTAVISLIPESFVTGAIPTAKFNGFTSANFDYDTLTMAAADAWNYLNGPDVDTDLGWSVGNHVDTACAVTVLPPGSAWPDDPSVDARKCLVQYVSNAARKDQDVAKHFVPRLNKHAAWEQFVTGATDSLTFRGTDVANTPSIRSRIGLLGLQLAGNTAIASETSHESHHEGDDACFETHHASIVFVVNADGSLTGWFSRGETNGCESSAEPDEDEEDSFQVTFTRPAAAP
jgi:hypothetical protein